MLLVVLLYYRMSPGKPQAPLSPVTPPPMFHADLSRKNLPKGANIAKKLVRNCSHD